MPAETVGIRKHQSYNHRVSSRGQAESELKQYCPTDSKCYFTWWDDSLKTYTLSVSVRGKLFRHFKIKTEAEGYEIEGSLTHFNDITSLLKYYGDSSIGDIDGIGDSFKPFKKSISRPQEGGSSFQRNERGTRSLHRDHGWRSYDDVRKANQINFLFLGSDACRR